MSFAMIAAGALLGTTGQPTDPTLTLALASKRIYQWMVVPGSNVFPVPTPFILVVPIGKSVDKLSEKLAVAGKARQELHIVIQTDKDGLITESFTQAVLDGIKNVIEETQYVEKALATTAKPDCTKSDPKQVIDPIVTGF